MKHLQIILFAVSMAWAFGACDSGGGTTPPSAPAPVSPPTPPPPPPPPPIDIAGDWTVEITALAILGEPNCFTEFFSADWATLEYPLPADPPWTITQDGEEISVVRRYWDTELDPPEPAVSPPDYTGTVDGLTATFDRPREPWDWSMPDSELEDSCPEWHLGGELETAEIGTTPYTLVISEDGNSMTSETVTDPRSTTRHVVDGEAVTTFEWTQFVERQWTKVPDSE